MRTIFTLLFILVAGSCIGQSPSAEGNLKQMEWLLGNWTRTNISPGKSGFELWTRASSSEWNGRGITMKGADTAFVEKIKIVIKDGSLWYVADVPENKQPIHFEITTVTKDSFVCENPNHDFPKKIEYKFDGKEIHARVSAGDKALDYVFVRSK